jgi:signal transduction histidine kinase
MAPLEGAARNTFYLTASFVVGTFTFCCLLTALICGVTLVIVWVGLPILAGTAVVARSLATLERHRAGALLGEAIPEPYAPPPESGVVRRARAVVADVATWKDLAWLLILLPALGLAGFTIAVSMWGASLGTMTLPAWYWALDSEGGVDYGLLSVDTAREAWLLVPVGVIGVVLTGLTVRYLARGLAGLARLVLGPTESQELARLRRTRAGAVDAQAAELQRIERDLHDGAQARLVALAMDLGMAQEKVSTDPQAAQVLVAQAHAEAKKALLELRDLSRGIYPAILTDRGLAAALSSVTARNPVPTALDVALDRRLPAAVEAAAYFVAVESLTNVAKHSDAQRCRVRVELRDGLLQLSVTDDGAGGAKPAGRGLTGLRKRVEALDGRLVVEDAHPGTRVRAELPCGSS